MRIRTALLTIVVMANVCNAQWTHIGLPGMSVTDLAAGNGVLFAVAGDSGSAYRSTDGGVTWLQIVQSGAREVAVAPTGTVFMLKDTLFRSSDSGNSWLPTVVPQLRLALKKIAVGCGGTVFCGFYSWHPGGSETGIRMSTDDGMSWDYVRWNGYLAGGLVFGFRGQNIISYGSGSVMFATYHEVFKSTNCGQSWDWLEEYIRISTLSLCSNGNVLAGAGYLSSVDDGIYLSTDGSASWTQVSLIVANDMLSVPSGGTLVGTTNLGVVLFGDNGDSLGLVNEQLANLNVHTLTLDNNRYVYVGTNNGVWRRPLSEMITDIESEQRLPTQFSLSQNYPNPFNPSTTIKYDLPRTSHVSLSVYDILGREVATLVNEEKEPGTYTVQWSAKGGSASGGDASGVSSGVYFYRLKAGDFVQTKRMLLVR